MDRLTALRIYLAVRLHFTTEGYDIFECKARVPNITADSITKTPQRARMVEHLSRRFDRPSVLMQYLVAQYAYTTTTNAAISAIHDVMTAEENFALWQRKKLALTQIILDDIHDYYKPSILGGDSPQILSMVAGGSVNIETAVAIQRLKPFLRNDYFAFQGIGVTIRKLNGFIKFNEQRVLSALEDLK